MPFTTIRRFSAPEKVAEQILSKIRSGELVPGGRLPAQRDLAVMLGVGRSSVREAINALVVAGVLEAVHGKGTFVSRSPQADAGLLKLKAALAAGSLLELLEAREFLECTSADLAAQRAEDDQIAGLHAALDQLDGHHPDYASFLKADMAFHFRLAEATDNCVIAEMTKLVMDKVVAQHRDLRTGRLSAAYRRASVDTARRVVLAVAKGDSAGAAHWMARHLGVIRSELAAILPADGGSPETA